MENKEVTIIAVVIILLALLWVGHNFAGKISAAPITLVPQGSQSAYNTSTGFPGTGYGASNAGYQNANSGQINNGYPTNQYDLAAKQAAIYGDFGGTIGAFGGGLF